mgnify:CR=1 FL=1
MVKKALNQKKKSEESDDFNYDIVKSLTIDNVDPGSNSSNKWKVGQVEISNSTEVDSVENNEETLESVINENFAFSNHKNSESESQNNTLYEKTSEISDALDKCINELQNSENFSIASLLRAQKPPKRTRKTTK